MRRISTRLDDRLLALVLLAAACASFLFPFARVMYEDVATVSGVTLVTADVDDEANGKDNLLASAAQTGGPFATLAVAGAILLAALFVPAEPLEFRPGDPFAQPPFEFLAPEWRGYFWRALEPVMLATAALVAAAALARGALLAAGAAVALRGAAP